MYKSIRNYQKKKTLQTQTLQTQSPVFKFTLQFEDSNEKHFEKNIVLGINNRKILAANIIQQIKQTQRVRADDSVSYFDHQRSSFVFWCKMNDQTIEDLNQNLIVSNQLKFKIRKSKKSFVDLLIDEQKKPFQQTISYSPNHNFKSQIPRNKQIGEIIRKVSLWRMLYLGFQTNKGQFIKTPLDTAAIHVGTAKKTLDDYLLQIRHGRQAGFDFNSKRGHSIGQLREYVLNFKKKVKRE